MDAVRLGSTTNDQPDRFILGQEQLRTAILTGQPSLVNAMPRAGLRRPRIRHVVGVDFSGAARSGKTAWLARLEVTGKREPLKLKALSRLGRLAGSDDRADVCQYLVEAITASKQTLWGFDFPFGLPTELGLGAWHEQLCCVRDYEFSAKDFGRQLAKASEKAFGKLHVRRVTDRETKTPFDCYHYRIIYQTFHGMRDVLLPVFRNRSTAVLPFQYDRFSKAHRLIVEACPASTLKRLTLPHQRYKQSGGKAPEAVHRQTRVSILRGIADLVQMTSHRRRVIMHDPGGDALDAVLAGVGAWHAFGNHDHAKIAAHDRYPIEGKVYC